MSSENLSVSIVICAYTEKRWSELIRAISSVRRQSTPANEIILVVDHNPALFGHSKEVFSDVSIIENQEEQGLSGARNSGIAAAHSQIIAFMDEDAVASSSWIESLLGSFIDQNIVGVGGEVRPLWAGRPPEWFPVEFNWVVGCSYRGLPESLASVRNPIGCNMAFRKEALVAAGGFRNGIGRIGTIPVGCEETELSIRIRQIYPGATILYQPQAMVYHRVPEWRARWGYFISRCYAEGLSKALVTRYVGADDGLSSERNYVSRTLPRGVIAGIRQAITQKTLDGVLRSGAIASGFSITTVGYLVGKARQLLGDQHHADAVRRETFSLNTPQQTEVVFSTTHLASKDE